VKTKQQQEISKDLEITTTKLMCIVQRTTLTFPNLNLHHLIYTGAVYVILNVLRVGQYRAVVLLVKKMVSNQSELKEIYMSGGEPTLIKHNLKLLKQIEKRDDLLIRVNSNMQWQTDNAILQEILKFPNVLFTCSVDGMGDKFNYIRRGGNWDKTLANIKFLKTQSNVDLRANTVFFVLTAQELPTIIDYFMDEIGSIDHTVNQLSMGQDRLRCRNLPDEVKNKVREQLNKTFLKYENNLNIAGNIKNCLIELDHDHDSDEYKKYFDKIDGLQGSNWRKLYPELT
jgi:organic radical activating enzyme